MNDFFAERIAGIPWAVLAAIALALAIGYAVLSAADGVSGAAFLILRWGHTAAWVFLSAAAAARARIGGLPMEWAAPLAATGGLIYVVFMVTATSGG
jgi:hypothetical protein